MNNFPWWQSLFNPLRNVSCQDYAPEIGLIRDFLMKKNKKPVHPQVSIENSSISPTTKTAQFSIRNRFSFRICNRGGV